MSRRDPRPEAARAGAALAILLASSVASAQLRTVVDLEPGTYRRNAGGLTRSTVALASAAVGPAGDVLLPYAGAALGIATAQLRVGLMVVPSGLARSGFIVRADARPNIVSLACMEPAIFGNVGAGYRWQLERGPVGSTPGVGFFLLPSFEAGPAWVRSDCSFKHPTSSPREVTLLFGGTVVLGIDL